MKWKSLPDEVKLLIIENVDPYTIPKLRQTCRSNKRLIDGSLRINYILQLAEDGYCLRHDCDTLPSLTEAIQQHLEWRKRWTTLDLGPVIHTLDEGEVDDVVLLGDMIYSSSKRKGRRLSLSKLLQSMAPMEGSDSWEKLDLGRMECRVLCGDASRNLLVVGIEDDGFCVELLFLSMSDLAPLAEPGNVDRERLNLYSAVQVRGPIVTYRGQRDLDQGYIIIVRELKTWSCIYELYVSRTYPASLILLTDEHFAILQKRELGIVLELRKLGSHFGTTLELPRTRKAVRSVQWNLTDNSLSGSTRLCRTGHSDVVVATLRFRPMAHNFLLVLSKRKLISLFDERTADQPLIAWEQWKHMARWLPDSESDTAICGSKIIFQAQWMSTDGLLRPLERNSLLHLIVLDFAISNKQEGSKNGRIISTMSRELFDDIFVEDLSGGLPFQVFWNPNEGRETFYDTILVTDSTIVLEGPKTTDVHWMGLP